MHRGRLIKQRGLRLTQLEVKSILFQNGNASVLETSHLTNVRPAHVRHGPMFVFSCDPSSAIDVTKTCWNDSV